MILTTETTCADVIAWASILHLIHRLLLTLITQEGKGQDD